MPDMPAVSAGSASLSNAGMSLLDYLTMKIPSIHASTSIHSSSTNSNSHKWAYPHSVKEWDDFYRFNRVTLSELYPKLLDKCSHPKFGEEDPLFKEVWNEASVQSIIKDWNATIVCEALKETQESLHPENRIYMVLGCFAPFDTGVSSNKFYPDWAAICKDQAWQPGRLTTPKSIMPGDTKISTKWKACNIQKVENVTEATRREQWFKPLAQIFNYCFRLQVRYGYLITDKELVVVRIGPKQTTSGPVTEDQKIAQTRDDGYLEYATIPAAPEESGNSLTVNLALWLLHLLAAKDNTIQWEYPLLNKDRNEQSTLPGQKQSTLPKQKQSRLRGREQYGQEEPADTEPDSESDATIVGEQADKYVQSFDASTGQRSPSPSVPTVSRHSTNTQAKRRLGDEQRGSKKKARGSRIS